MQMTDSSLTRGSASMEKRRKLCRKEKEQPSIHLIPAPLRYEPIQVRFTGVEHSLVQEAAITLFFPPVKKPVF